MLRKMFLLTVVLLILASVALTPAAAQEEGGIVCDDGTVMLLLMAEIHGYSQSESTLLAPVDLTQFDFGENQFAFDLLVPAFADAEMEPLTDEIIASEVMPLNEEIGAEYADATQTSHGDIVDEDPACRELRESVTTYLAVTLLREYAAMEAE